MILSLPGLLSFGREPAWQAGPPEGMGRLSKDGPRVHQLNHQQFGAQRASSRISEHRQLGRAPTLLSPRLCRGAFLSTTPGRVRLAPWL